MVTTEKYGSYIAKDVLLKLIFESVLRMKRNLASQREVLQT